MKLKKAMKKYDIKTEPWINTSQRYTIGERSIYIDPVRRKWSVSGKCVWFETEEQAVAWLIAGATPLSPMERAIRKWPIRKDGKKYYLGERFVFPRVQNDGLWWAGYNGPYDISEKEAVAYLLEGYKPKMPDVKVILEHVDVEKDKKITGIDKNVCLGFGPTQAQTVLDTIWRAGYRPTKEGK
jgi:hypothetical protein